MLRKSFLLVLAIAVSANASQLFTNGGLETNGGNGSTSFAVWSTGGTDTSDDDFYADDMDITPLNGFPTVGPDSGSWYAVSDMTGLVSPEESFLIQSVTIPIGTTDLVFSADLFVNDQFGAGGSGGEFAIWANGANPLTDAPLAILYGPSDTAETDGEPNPYILVSVDVTSDVTPGATYEFGVVESDATGPINVGVDDFSLDASSSTPEPAMLFPTALLAAGMFIYRARRKVRAQV